MWCWKLIKPTRLGEELDAAKGANDALWENVKKLTSELKEAKKGQVEVMESYSQCKEDFQTANTKLQFAFEKARVALKNGREEFRNSEAYVAELEGVF